MILQKQENNTVGRMAHFMNQKCNGIVWIVEQEKH